MKLHEPFFYIAFIAVACVIAVGSRGDNNINSASLAVLAKMDGIAEYQKKSPTNADISCHDCNIILLSVDSLRADHIGAYGYARDTTPYFDSLAKNGILFENYFSTSFLTPVSEMSVHTGMYPSANKTTNFDTVLPEDITTLAQYFKQKGYATSALLSSPEFEMNPALKKSFLRGFERYEYSKEGERAFPSNVYMKEELDIFSDEMFFWWVSVGGVHWPYGEHGPNVFADETYNGVFRGKYLNWWDAFQYIYKGVFYPEKIAVGDTDIQYVVDQYDNGVRAFDEFLKEFITELTRRNLLDRTIIIIQSEHGEDLHEHGYFAHYDILDTQTHVPLLILFPRLATERRIVSFASSVDIFPTIAELLGQASLSQFQGKTLAPIIRNYERDGARQEVFLERSPLWEETFSMIDSLKKLDIEVGSGRHKDIGIRTSQWKYILRTSKQTMKKINWWQAMTGKKIDFSEEELYDLANDPGEMKNVAYKYPKETAVLRRKLNEWSKKIYTTPYNEPDTMPVIQPYF